jgi:hypothetical protein
MFNVVIFLGVQYYTDYDTLCSIDVSSHVENINRVGCNP